MAQSQVSVICQLCHKPSGFLVIIIIIYHKEILSCDSISFHKSEFHWNNFKTLREIFRFTAYLFRKYFIYMYYIENKWVTTGRLLAQKGPVCFKHWCNLIKDTIGILNPLTGHTTNLTQVYKNRSINL